MRNRIRLVLTLVALLLVAGVPFGVAWSRQAGRGDLAALLDRHEAAGHGSSFEDLVSSAPAQDPIRQAKAATWLKAGVPPEALRDGHHDLGWRLESKSPPAQLLAAHEAFRPAAEELTALLAPGDLCLTSLRSLPRDPSQARLVERVPTYGASDVLLPRRTFRYFALEAMLRADPTPTLDTLDRLHASVARAGCTRDGMLALSWDATRDEVYLVLGLAGALHLSRFQAWLEEPPRARSLVADGLRGDRLRFAAPLARDVAEGGSVADHLGVPTGGPKDLWYDRVLPHFQGPRDCRVLLEAYLAVEQWTRGTIGEAEAREAVAACDQLHRLVATTYPSLTFRDAAVACEERHRFVRVASALARAARERGTRPKDDVEAHAWVARVHSTLAGGEPAWRYEPWGTGWIRVVRTPGPSPLQPKPARRHYNVVDGGVEIRIR